MKWLVVVLVFLALPVVLVVIVGSLLPKQHTATRSLALRRSPEEVWSVIAGPPTWRRSVRKYEPLGRLDGKMTWREIDEHNHGITYEEDDASPPRRRVTHIADKNLPFGGTWIYEIQPTSSGCELRITENGEVYNPVFRLISRYFMGHTATIDRYLKDVAAHFGEPPDLQD